MSELLTSLATSLVPVLAVLGLLLALSLVVLWLVFRTSRVCEDLDDPDAGGAGSASPAAGGTFSTRLFRKTRPDPALTASFRDARRLLVREHGRDGVYAQPWQIVLGEAGSGKTSLLHDAGFRLPYGEPPADGGAAGLGWWMTGQGVVLDVDGRYVLDRDSLGSDEAGWRSLLELIRRTRSRRPLDGIVLTVPAYALLAPDGRPWQPSVTSSRATVLSAKLRELSAALGMRLPVYLAVTRCDGVEGFDDLLAALDPAEEQEIFGWSTPGDPAGRYSPSWIGRAFARVRLTLDRIALDAAAGHRERTGEASSLLRFPQNLGRMSGPLEVYTNQIFGGAHGRELMLRGIYFTGGQFGPALRSVGAAAAPGAVAARPAAERAAERWDLPGGRPGAHGPGAAAERRPTRILFVPDLFADKVFPESPLGTPTAAAMERAGKSVRRLAVAMPLLLLAGLLAFPAGYRQSRARAETIEPLVETVTATLGGTPVPDTGPPAPTPSGGVAVSSDARPGAAILETAETVPAYRTGSIFLPGSWINLLDGRVRRVVIGTWEQVVLPIAQATLERNLALLATGLPVYGGSGGEILAAHDTAAYTPLLAYVPAVARLDGEAATYDRIARQLTLDGSALLADFRSLTRYVWQIPFVLPSHEATRFYERVLDSIRPSHVPQLDVTARIGSLRANARRLTLDVYDELFSSQVILVDLDVVDQDLTALVRASGGTASPRLYRDLESAIDKTEADLVRPEVQWILASSFPTDPRLQETLATMAATPWLGPALVAELDRSGDLGFAYFKNRLGAFSADATGPFLARKAGEIELQLSDGVQTLDAALEAYLGEPFMQPALPLQPRLEAPAGTRLRWNSARLSSAHEQASAYQNFLAEGLELFPASMRASTAAAARRPLAVNMMERIARAQSFPAVTTGSPSLLEAVVRAEVSNLQTVTPTFEQLFEDFGTLGFDLESQRLGRVIRNQQNTILADVDGLWESADLYAPRDPDFSFWNGRIPPPLSWPSYGVSSAKGLVSYLSSQRDRAETLAGGYAQPVLAAGAGAGTVMPLDLPGRIRFWDGILADLEAYSNKVAGNPIGSLESFITGPMSEVDLDNCFETIPESSLAGPVGDSFSARETSLARGIHDRCTTLLGTESRAAYSRVADSFNQQLAGRFPFSQDLPGPYVASATPAALLGFFGVFDRYTPLFAEIPLGLGVFGNEDTEVLDFLNRAGEARRFFAAYLDQPEDSAPPSFGFAVDFRVDRSREAGANQIIDWSLEVGETSFHVGDPPEDREGLWTYQTPVTFRLRWAEDSTEVPVAAHGGTVEGRAAVFHHADPWALLSLLREHLTSPWDPRNPSPVTLLFEVETGSAADPTRATGTAAALVRVTLRSSDSTKALLAYPQFPVSAPELDGRVETVPLSVPPPAVPTVTTPAPPPPPPPPPAEEDGGAGEKGEMG